MLSQRRLDEVLAFINRYTDENGFPPTVRDMCRELGIKSTATAYDYINRLKEQGHLEKAEGKKRAVALKNTGGTVRVPLIGTVTAGTPILAAENYDGYYVLPSAEFSGDGLFLLTVQGDSMIGAGIKTGDIVIIRHQPIAADGDIVAASVNNEVTLKRLVNRPDRIALEAENPEFKPIELTRYDSFRVIGKMVGIIKQEADNNGGE